MKITKLEPNEEYPKGAWYIENVEVEALLKDLHSVVAGETINNIIGRWAISVANAAGANLPIKNVHSSYSMYSVNHTYMMEFWVYENL